MGLDISAYSELTPSTNVLEDDRIVGITQSLLDQTEKDFPGRTVGLSAGVFSFRGNLGFHAGSYGGYGNWRRKLSLLALGVTPEEVWKWDFDVAMVPFYELIRFTDCEGYIGPETAYKLSVDFQSQRSKLELKSKAKPRLEVTKYGFWPLYEEWQKAFELASDCGLVHFH